MQYSPVGFADRVGLGVIVKGEHALAGDPTASTGSLDFDNLSVCKVEQLDVMCFFVSQKFLGGHVFLSGEHVNCPSRLTMPQLYCAATGTRGEFNVISGLVEFVAEAADQFKGFLQTGCHPLIFRA